VPVADAAAAASGFDDELLATIPNGTIGGQVLDAARHPAPNVVVYVKKGPSTGKAAAERVVIDQQNKTFLPHVLPIAVGTRVEFKNSDPVLHNVYSRVAAKTFDLGMFDKSQSKSVVFDRPGRVDVFCSIHTNMHAVILVLESTAFATTDVRGFFTIPNLPAGNYRLAIWDEVVAEHEVSVDVAANAPAIVKHELVAQ